MPARDLLHEIIRQLLIQEGWIITHDPYTISYGMRRVYADLGAEELIAAENSNNRHIVVEVKSFVGPSKITDLERAVGQYVIYKSWLHRKEPEYTLYLALEDDDYNALFLDISGQALIEDYGIKMIVVNVARMEVVKWIN